MLSVTLSTHVDERLLLRAVRVPLVGRLIDTARHVGRWTVTSREDAEYQSSDANVTRRAAAWSDVERVTVSRETLRQFTLQSADASATYKTASNSQARFPSKRNRLRWEAANHGCHCFDRASYWLLLASNRMLGRSNGNHDWLLSSFQRKRLRLDGNRASVTIRHLFHRSPAVTKSVSITSHLRASTQR